MFPGGTGDAVRRGRVHLHHRRRARRRRPGRGPGQQVPGRARRRHRRRHADPALHLQRHRRADRGRVTRSARCEALGKCLDVAGGATADGTKIQLWTCNGTRRPELGGRTPTADRCRNPQSGKCLDVVRQQLRPTAQAVHLWTCHDRRQPEAGPCPDLTRRPRTPPEATVAHDADASRSLRPLAVRRCHRRARRRLRSATGTARPRPPTPRTTCWSSPRPPASGTTRSRPASRRSATWARPTTSPSPRPRTPTAFTTANLAQYEAVVFLNTTGDVLNATQQTAFESYIRGGGGYVGVHAAADTEYDWPFYGNLVGAYFASHPAIQQATVRVEDRAHPATAHLPQTWTRTDEWYNYRPTRAPPPRCWPPSTSRRTPAAAWAPTTRSPGARRYGGGRSFYTGLGHTQASYAEPAFRGHLLGGIRYAAGRAKADCRPGDRLHRRSTTARPPAGRRPGPGSFTNTDATLTSVGGMGLLWYSAKQFTHVLAEAGLADARRRQLRRLRRLPGRRPTRGRR